MSSVRRMLVLLAAAGALTVMLWPALVGRDILGFRDMLHNYGPMRAMFWSGRISLWNDRAFGGSSVLADIVQQPFYLGQLVMRALHAPAWPGIPIRLWLHSLFGMWAMERLMRRFVPPHAAGVAVAAFGLCGFCIANFSNPQWECAQMWVPMILLAADFWATEGGAGRACLLAASLPQPLLPGDPPLLGLAALTAGALVIARRRRPARQLAQEGALIALAAAVIASPQIVSTMRAMSSFARGAGLPRTVREQWSLHPARIAELFVPRLFGPLFSHGFWGGFTVTPPFHRNYIHSIYAGAIGPGLLAVALWKRRRSALAWVLLAVVTLIFSLGAWFFHVYGSMGDLFALLRLFRYPQRIVALFAIAWAALLALGAAGIVELPRRHRVLIAGGSFAFAGVALAATAALAPASAPSAVWHSAVQLALAGGATIAALLLPARLAGPALGLVLIADLSAANAELLGLLPRAPLRAPSAACEALDAARGQRRIGSFRVYVDEEALAAKTVPDWNEERVREYNWGKRNLLEPCGYRQSVSLSSLDPADELRLWREVSPLRTLEVMGTRYVITTPEAAPGFHGSLRSIDPLWNFAVVELPDAEPLLFRPERVESLASAALPAAALARRELLRTHVAAIDAKLTLHGEDGTAELVSVIDNGSEVHFRVRQKEPGYWVLA